MNNSQPVEHNHPWWKERMVWLIIALPASAVLAGLATVYIAYRDPDDLVKTDYVKSGMTVVAPRDALDAAARMGLAGSLIYQEGTLSLRLDRLGQAADTLTLTMVHPTQAELDQQIPLTAAGGGTYQARIELTGQGRRQLILEPPDHAWRLEGEWHAPFTEETRLHAGTHNPSTHP